MMRAVLLVSLGLGFVALPHTVWLFALALLLTAVSGLPDWRGPSKRSPVLAVRIRPTGAHHFHYCAGCDAQWLHPGESTGCTQHWALRCPRCAPLGPRDERRVA
jgi:hypothetical protein